MSHSSEHTATIYTPSLILIIRIVTYFSNINSEAFKVGMILLFNYALAFTFLNLIINIYQMFINLYVNMEIRISSLIVISCFPWVCKMDTIV